MQNLAQDLEPPVPPEEITAAEAETPKAEVEAPKVETPKEEPKAEGKEEVQPEKLVRLEALHEERQKRKELAKQLDQLKREQAQRDAVINDRLSQLYAASQPKEQPPDPNDPLAVIDHRQKTAERELAELRQHKEQQEAAYAQQQRVHQMVDWYQNQASEFEKEAPDFRDAYAHMQKLRIAQIRAVVGNNPQHIKAALEQDELQVVWQAMQSGQNPAAMIYQMAKDTGFTKAVKDVSAEQKLEMQKKGSEAAKSISGSSGGGVPTPEQIAAMSDDEFAEFKAKLGKKGQRISDAL